jgi:hypothetical protein
VSWLRNARTGDALNVLRHPELGDRRVDLIYGSAKGGIQHIDTKHPGWLDTLPKNWSSMESLHDGPNRIRMHNEKAMAVIPKDFGGHPKNWLLTYFEKNRGDRPEGKLLDSASAKDRAVPFPDRPVDPNIVQTPHFLNAVREPGSLALSRTISAALAGINPLIPKPASPQPPTSSPPGVISSEPMLPWLFPSPIWGAARHGSSR